MKNRQNNFLMIFFFGALVLIGAIYSIINNRQLKNDGKYTIAKIEKIEAGGKGCNIVVTVSFVYNKKENLHSAGCYSKNDLGDAYIGKRVFIKFVPNNDNAFKIYFECNVPDYLQQKDEINLDDSIIKKLTNNCN